MAWMAWSFHSIGTSAPAALASRTLPMPVRGKDYANGYCGPSRLPASLRIVRPIRRSLPGPAVAVGRHSGGQGRFKGTMDILEAMHCMTGLTCVCHRSLPDGHSSVDSGHADMHVLPVRGAGAALVRRASAPRLQRHPHLRDAPAAAGTVAGGAAAHRPARRRSGRPEEGQAGTLVDVRRRGVDPPCAGDARPY